MFVNPFQKKINQEPNNESFIQDDEMENQMDDDIEDEIEDEIENDIEDEIIETDPDENVHHPLLDDD